MLKDPLPLASVGVGQVLTCKWQRKWSCKLCKPSFCIELMTESFQHVSLCMRMSSTTCIGACMLVAEWLSNIWTRNQVSSRDSTGPLGRQPLRFVDRLENLLCKEKGVTWWDMVRWRFRGLYVFYMVQPFWRPTQVFQGKWSGRFTLRSPDATGSQSVTSPLFFFGQSMCSEPSKLKFQGGFTRFCANVICIWSEGMIKGHKSANPATAYALPHCDCRLRRMCVAADEQAKSAFSMQRIMLDSSTFVCCWQW